MRRNPERLSDPFENRSFHRSWTDPLGGIEHIGAPVDRVLRRIEDQRARDDMARQLRRIEQHQDDAKIVMAAAARIVALRRETRQTWHEILHGRAA